jgi:TctA family transporter
MIPVLAVSLVEAVNLVAAVIGLFAIAFLVVYVARPDRDREAEDDARSFYDRTGRWPDD